VGVGICFFQNNSWVRVFENKKFKESLRSGFVNFLEDFKNRLSSGLKTPKRDGYEVGAQVKVCD
jgi:hypothetical protein